MVTGSMTGGCWPTKQQEQLLRAALLQGQDSIAAWTQWESGIDVHHLDGGSVRMLPQLYRNLRAQGIDHPLMMKFKGVYRNTWYKNQILFHQMAALLHSFHQAGIKTLLLKGASLILQYYKDYGLRPMTDVDVLVPVKQAPAAIRFLREQNWMSKYKIPEVLTEEFLSAKHSRQFREGKGSEVDLHWHVLEKRCQPNADDDFWEGAVPVDIQGVSTYALNPADQLLHVCVHGAKWDRVPPLRWIADAMTLLNTSPEIDWNRLLDQAQKLHLILPLREALNYLKNLLEAPVPSTVLQRMRGMPASNAEYLEYQAMTRRRDLTGPVLLLWFHYQEYRRSLNGVASRHKLLGFPKFLQQVWGISLWQVPFYGVFRGMRRIWRKWSLKVPPPRGLSHISMRNRQG